VARAAAEVAITGGEWATHNQVETIAVAVKLASAVES
jgi:hypothetical protein